MLAASTSDTDDEPGTTTVPAAGPSTPPPGATRCTTSAPSDGCDQNTWYAWPSYAAAACSCRYVSGPPVNTAPLHTLLPSAARIAPTTDGDEAPAERDTTSTLLPSVAIEGMPAGFESAAPRASSATKPGTMPALTAASDTPDSSS